MDAIEPLTTLVAAFAGAWAAFRLDRWAQQNAEHKRRSVSANKVMFSIATQVTVLSNLQKQIVDPDRDSPWRYIAMRPMLGFKAELLHVDLSEIAFLLETEDRNLLLEYTLEIDRFRSALAAMEERSRIHVESIQPRLEEIGFIEGNPIAQNVVDSGLGTRMVATMQRLTDDVVASIDDTLASHLAFAEKFRSAMKKTFPKETIIGVGLPQPAM